MKFASFLSPGSNRSYVDEPSGDSEEWDSPRRNGKLLHQRARHIVDFQIVQRQPMPGHSSRSVLAPVALDTVDISSPNVLILGNLVKAKEERSNSPSLEGRGTTKRSKSPPVLRIQLKDVEYWYLDDSVGENRGVWVATPVAVYKLVMPKDSYAPLYRSMRFKSSLCLSVIDALRCRHHPAASLEVLQRCSCCQLNLAMLSTNDISRKLKNVLPEKIRESAYFLCNVLTHKFPDAKDFKLVSELKDHLQRENKIQSQNEQVDYSTVERAPGSKWSKAKRSVFQSKAKSSSQNVPSLSVTCSLCRCSILATDVDTHSTTCLVIGESFKSISAACA